MFKSIWAAVAGLVLPLILGGALWVVIFKLYNAINGGFNL